MAICYKKQQFKIIGSKSYGKWFAKAVSMGDVNTRELAEEINHSITVTKGFQRGKHLRLPCALQARHEVRAIWSGQLKRQSQG